MSHRTGHEESRSASTSHTLAKMNRQVPRFAPTDIPHSGAGRGLLGGLGSKTATAASHALIRRCLVMDLSEIQLILEQFAEDRSWGQFHTPRNLLLALVGEVGELAAEFQWLSDGELEAEPLDADKREAVQNEMADVLIYLLRLAQVLNIDMTEAFIQKQELNSLKYPVSKSFGSRDKYTQLD